MSAARTGNSPLGGYGRFSPEAAERAVEVLLENLFEGAILATLGDRRVVYANRLACQWLCWPPNSLFGLNLSAILSLAPPVDLESLLDQIDGEPQEGFTAAGQLLACDGQLLDVELRLCQVAWNGQPHVAVLLRRPPTTLDYRTHIHPAAVSFDRRDPLTGLADRAALLSRLESDLRNRASNPGFALLFVDLDNFKQVNDAHGHLTGDRVLRDVAERLTQCVRADDCVFRYGGDEFVVLLQRVADAEETKPIVDRIHAALADPIKLPDGEIALAVSIGVAMASPTHQSAEDLLAEADRAMYASKRDGR